jgi:hypothetical protein
MREMSFSITVSDEDLARFGIDPTKVSKPDFRNIVAAIEDNLMEDHFHNAIKNALIDVIGWNETNIDLDKLEERRLKIAESVFQDATLPPIDATNGWESSGKDTLIRTIFWTNPIGGDSVKGNFKVEFKPNSFTVNGSWHS